MQRDMDLVREILVAVETAPYGTVGQNSLPDHDPLVVAYHIDLMEEAGLVEAAVARADGAGAIAARVNKMTWSGHEFLDAVSDDSIWTKAKQKAGTASFEVLMAVAVALLKARVGL